MSTFHLTTLEGKSLFKINYLLVAAACLLVLAGSCSQQSVSGGGNSAPIPLIQSEQVVAEQIGSNYKIGFRGETMGTTWTATCVTEDSSYVVKSGAILEGAFKLLARFNLAFSTYDPNSRISLAQQEVEADVPQHKMQLSGENGAWLEILYHTSQEVYTNSNALFDPTIMPLVRYWGFFKEDPFAGATTANVQKIDSLVKLVDFSKVEFMHLDTSKHSNYISWPANMSLDFNAVAKGLGVDVLKNYFINLGVEHVLVEIGGEVAASGQNDKGTPWGIALEKPKEGAREFMSLVQLPDRAMATSGNYRNFWEKDGLRYGHTLNPKTGYPEKSSLLSATVIAPDCASADAYATACMVMGLDKALKMIEADERLEAMFISLDKTGAYNVLQSSGFSAFVVESDR